MIDLQLTPTLRTDERERLARVADVLIPEGDTMPSASAVDVQGTGIDRVFTVRPDLVDGVRVALEDLGDGIPASFDALYASPPEGFAQLAEAVTAAYFLDPGVAKAVGYRKRSEIPIVFDTDLDELTAAVIARGPIYRPTPDLGPDGRKQVNQ